MKLRISPGAKPGERAADLMGGEDLGDIPACLGRRPGAGESTLNPTPTQGRSRGYSAPINPQPKDMLDQNDDN